jgi:hypothetical protein
MRARSFFFSSSFSPRVALTTGIATTPMSVSRWQCRQALVAPTAFGIDGVACTEDITH